MSYFPYLRGKQYELICLRENSDLIARAGFTPIVEPVRADVAGLVRCIDAFEESGANLLLVSNPGCGALAGYYPNTVVDQLEDRVSNSTVVSWLHRYENNQQLESWLDAQEGGVVLHSSPTSASDFLQAEINSGRSADTNIFVEGKDSGALYRRALRKSNRILVRDGFRKKKNSDYLNSPVEHFSDLHITFREEGMQGFGDFLTVGDEYSETGGPAYAVAIHITFVDPNNEGSMFMHHFVSDSNDTPADPAGKFGEALAKLAASVRTGDGQIAQTAAVGEFLALYDRGHYPGLGYVKKLSMQHHLEVMSTVDFGE